MFFPEYLAEELVLKTLIEHFEGNAEENDFLSYIKDHFNPPPEVYKEFMSCVNRAIHNLSRSRLLEEESFGPRILKVTENGRIYFDFMHRLKKALI